VTHEDYEARLTESRFYKRDVHDALKVAREAHQAEIIAKWRAANPEATCSDRVALVLAELAAGFQRGTQ